MHFPTLKSGIWNKSIWPIGILNEFRLWSQFVALTKLLEVSNLHPLVQMSHSERFRDSVDSGQHLNPWKMCSAPEAERKCRRVTMTERQSCGWFDAYGGSWKVSHRGCSLGEGPSTWPHSLSKKMSCRKRGEENRTLVEINKVEQQRGLWGGGCCLGGVTEDRWCLDALDAERRGVCNSQQCSEISGVQQPARCVPAGGWPRPSGTGPDTQHHLSSTSDQTVDLGTPEWTHMSAKTQRETLKVSQRGSSWQRWNRLCSSTWSTKSKKINFSLNKREQTCPPVFHHSTLNTQHKGFKEKPRQEVGWLCVISAPILSHLRVRFTHVIGAQDGSLCLTATATVLTEPGPSEQTQLFRIYFVKEPHLAKKKKNRSRKLIVCHHVCDFSVLCKALKSCKFIQGVWVFLRTHSSAAKLRFCCTDCIFTWISL